MSKKKQHRYLDWCYIPILKGVLVVVCTDDYKWVERKFNAPDTVDDSMYAVTLHGEYKGYDAYIIILNLWRDTAMNHSIIAHEAVHVTNFIFKERGWRRLKNDEPQCYFTEWFTNKTYQFLKKNKLHKLIVNDNHNQ